MGTYGKGDHRTSSPDAHPSHFPVWNLWYPLRFTSVPHCVHWGNLGEKCEDVPDASHGQGVSCLCSSADLYTHTVTSAPVTLQPCWAGTSSVQMIHLACARSMHMDYTLNICIFKMGPYDKRMWHPQLWPKEVAGKTIPSWKRDLCTWVAPRLHLSK